MVGADAALQAAPKCFLSQSADGVSGGARNDHAQTWIHGLTLPAPENHEGVVATDTKRIGKDYVHALFACLIRHVVQVTGRIRCFVVYRGIDQASVQSRSEEHTSELQSQSNLVCRLLLEKKKIAPTQKLYRGPLC